MTPRSRAIEAGDGTAGARLEYIRSRRALRLGGWHSGGTEIPPVELPAATLLPRLGIAPDELGAAALYLLLAGGRHGVAPGPRRTTTGFASEVEARDAFRRLRTDDSVPAVWAELFALDITGGLKLLCWFGEPGETASAPLPDAGATLVGADVPARSQRRRWRTRVSRAAG